MNIPVRQELSGEEIATALAALGEDATAERVEELRVRIDVRSLPTGNRHDALLTAVETARRNLDAHEGALATAQRTLLRYHDGDRVSDLYDSDDEFADALRTVAGPGFEYPDFSWMAVGQARRHAERSRSETMRVDAPNPDPRLRVVLLNNKGESVWQMRSEDPKEALSAFVRLTKRQFGDEHGVGSHVALVDMNSELDAAKVYEGRKTYIMKFGNDHARDAFYEAEARAAKLPPEIGSEYRGNDPDFEGIVKVKAVYGDRVFYEGDADGSATIAEFHKAYAPIDVEEQKLPKTPLTETQPTSTQSRKPSIATLQELLVAKRANDVKALIERLQEQTNRAYAEYGVGSRQYEQLFDDLHSCRMVQMALDFRAAHGLPPDASTPYDDADLAGWFDEVRNLLKADEIPQVDELRTRPDLVHQIPGTCLGHGLPDWPEDLTTFEERRAYQRGVAHARYVDKSVELTDAMERVQRKSNPLANNSYLNDCIRRLQNGLDCYTEKAPEYAEISAALSALQGLQRAPGPQASTNVTQTGPDYSVSVDVEVTANSPEEAARLALDDLRDEALEAWTMDVKCIQSGAVTKVSVPGYSKNVLDQPDEGGSQPSLCM